MAKKFNPRRAKLTNRQREHVRKRLLAGDRVADIASSLGVSGRCIYHIAEGFTSNPPKSKESSDIPISPRNQRPRCPTCGGSLLRVPCEKCESDRRKQQGNIPPCPPEET